MASRSDLDDLDDLDELDENGDLVDPEMMSLDEVEEQMAPMRVPDTTEVSVAQQIEVLKRRYDEAFEKDPRFTFHLYRDKPKTDTAGHECKGFVDSFNEIFNEKEIARRFGGSLYHAFIRGPARDPETDKLTMSVLATIRGIQIAGPPIPNAADRHYQKEDGHRRIREYEEFKRSRDRDRDSDFGDDRFEKLERAPRLMRPPNPVAVASALAGANAADDAVDKAPTAFPVPTRRHVPLSDEPTLADRLAEKKLDAEIRERDETRKRAWDVEDAARNVLKEAKAGVGGMDTDALKLLVAEITNGNVKAIEQLSTVFADGNTKTAEATRQLIQMLQTKIGETRDDREEQRLKELLDSAQSDLRAIRNEHQAELTRIDTAHRDEVKNLRDERDRAEERVTDRLESLFNGERKTWEETRKELIAAREKAEAAIEKANERADATIKAEEKRGDDRVEALKAAHKAEVEAVRSTAKADIERLRDKITRLEDKIDTLDQKERDLRDARQLEHTGKVRAEMERDNAKSEAERLDLDKVVKATGVAETIARSMGYEKPDTSAPSVWGGIGEKALEVAGNVITNEKFGNLLGNLTNMVRDRADRAAPPQPPPSQLPPAQPSQDQQSWDDMIAKTRQNRAAALEAEKARRAAEIAARQEAAGLNPAPAAGPPAAPPSPGGRQLAKPSRATTEASAMDALSLALADEPVQPNPGAPPPKTQPATPQKPAEPEEDQAGQLIDGLESLASANVSPEEALQTVLAQFGATRQEARLLAKGKDAGALLKMAGIDPVEVSGQARRLLTEALKLL